MMEQHEEDYITQSEREAASHFLPSCSAACQRCPVQGGSAPEGGALGNKWPSLACPNRSPLYPVQPSADGTAAPAYL